MSDKQRPQGLDKDAYLNAEQLFRATGDLRYLVVAIGKPKSSYFKDGEIPVWALKACQEYAETIREATDLERTRIKTAAIAPLNRNVDLEAYRRATKAIFRPRLNRPDLGRKPLSFERAIKLNGVIEPHAIRNLRRNLRKELRPELSEEGTVKQVNRRVEEMMLVRSAKRRHR